MYVLVCMVSHDCVLHGLRYRSLIVIACCRSLHDAVLSFVEPSLVE